MFRRKRGQSVLEFALLLGIVLVVIMIMQVFVKRGLSGRFKESAESLGEQFSAGGTTTQQARNLTSDQVIQEETGTRTAGAQNLTSMGFDAYTVRGAVDQGAVSYNLRTGGNATTTSESRTESAQTEKFGWGEYANETFDNFNLSD